MNQQACTCGICGADMAGARCVNCAATREGQDMARAIGFARRSFVEFQIKGLVSPSQQECKDRQLDEQLQRVIAAARAGEPVPGELDLASVNHCWRCNRQRSGYYAFCNVCGASHAQSSDELRYLMFLARSIDQTSTEVITPSQQAALADVVQQRTTQQRLVVENDQLSAADLSAARLDQLRLKKEGGSSNDTMHAEAATQRKQSFGISKPALKRQSLLEIVLDPRNIRWLLGSGGGLLVGVGF